MRDAVTLAFWMALVGCVSGLVTLLAGWSERLAMTYTVNGFLMAASILLGANTQRKQDRRSDKS